MLDAALIGVRLCHYVAVLLLFGTAVFPLYGFARGDSPDEAFAAWSRRALRGGAVAALLTGVLWLVLTTAVMAGGLAPALDPATLGMTLGGTDFGRLWSGRLALAVLLSGLAFLPRPPGAVIIAGAAILLGSLGWAGHAAPMDHSVLSWLHSTSDALHLLAAGVWIGALAAFGVLLRREGGAMAAGSLSRFSGVGAASVAVLAATGVLNGWIILGGPDALLGATWGWLLIAKVGLFGAMLALAAANRLWLTPRLLRAPDAQVLGRLRSTILAEQGLALLVLGLVAVLGTLDPKG